MGLGISAVRYWSDRDIRPISSAIAHPKLFIGRANVAPFAAPRMEQP